MFCVIVQKLVNKLFLLLVLFSVSGCSTLGYYLDLAEGHSELMEKKQAIDDLLVDEELRPELRKMLEKSIKIRNFASKSLYLPENDSYREYADLQRPYAVWNVVAAPKYQLKPKKWCFMVVGCLSYRGYFSKQEAQQYASQLEKQGFDVYIGGARAYSTLGWFDDPLLNTMMYKSEAYRAGIIFHELAHQLLYIEDDSAFNEAFATAVEQEGIRRWFNQHGKKKENEYQQYLKEKKRDVELNALLKQTREQLSVLYEKKVSDQVKAEKKKLIFSQLKKDYMKLKESWDGYSGYDKWMQQGLNNAHLLLVATYHDLVPAFNRLLKAENNDLKRFYKRVEKISELEKEKRTAALNEAINLFAKN